MSIKREYRISSEDSARPAVTIQDEPRYFAQGLKPEPAHAVEEKIVRREDDEVVRKTTFSNGTVRETLLSKEDHLDAKPEAPTRKAKAKE